jgi:hypothetical protein
MTSNLLPLKDSYINGIHPALVSHIDDYVTNFKYLQIITGPVFDYNGDGIKDDLEKS